MLVVDATQAAAEYDLCGWQARIQALENFDYLAVSAVFKRVNNIVLKNKVEQAGILREPSELALQKAIHSVDISKDFPKILQKLSELKPILDQFFEEIMVMVEDKELREARLGLLSEVQKKAAYVADFSKLTT